MTMYRSGPNTVHVTGNVVPPHVIVELLGYALNNGAKGPGQKYPTPEPSMVPPGLDRFTIRTACHSQNEGILGILTGMVEMVSQIPGVFQSIYGNSGDVGRNINRVNRSGSITCIINNY